MNKQLKEDNGDLLTQLDKFGKRIKQVEGEVRREQENSGLKDLTIQELNRQVSSLMQTMEKQKEEITQAQRQLQRE